jgi:membrane-associated phospholipid phosphatase
LAGFACAASLGLLAVVALGLEAGRDLDSRLFARLSEDPRYAGGGPAEAIASLGDLLPMLALLAIACGIALLRRRPWSALAAVAIVAGANVTTQLLKVLLAHPRVKAAIGGNPLEPNTFPSGHTTAMASLAVAYLFVVPATWRGLTLLVGGLAVLAVGSSVVMIAWHYPSDVLGGILVAAGWGFAVLALGRAIKPRSRRARDQLSSPVAISVK